MATHADDRSAHYDCPVNESVGVTRSVANLKRDLLFFDRLQILGLDALIEGDDPHIDDAVRADCQYLVDRGAIVAGPNTRSELLAAIDRKWAAEFASPSTEALHGTYQPGVDLRSLPAVIRAQLLASTANHPAGLLGADEPFPNGGELVVAFAEECSDGVSAVPILTTKPNAQDLVQLSGTFLGPAWDQTRLGYVSELVVARFPIPGDDVPLDEVLDFVSDPVQQLQMRALRLWMTRAAMGHDPLDVLTLEFETLLHDFEVQMRVADMRASDSFFRVAISVPLEIAQELMHLRPKAAFNAAFSLRARQADRLESMLSAPGREVAFLGNANQRFRTAAHSVD